jgi:oligopeptide transport system substrate-binding protein
MDDYPMIPLLQYTCRASSSPGSAATTSERLDRYRSKDLYILKH